MANRNFIDLNETEFADALKSFERMSDSIDGRYLKNTQARIARKRMVPDMRRGSKSTRIEKMISVTTAKRRAGPLGIKVGVVKNDPDLFPTFSAPALASVIEYGTAERYRQLQALGLITGRVSTGSMPAAPFLRPAWDKNVLSLMDDVERLVLKRIEDHA